MYVPTEPSTPAACSTLEGTEALDKVPSSEKGRQLAASSRRRRLKGRDRAAILLTSGEHQLLEWALKEFRSDGTLMLRPQPGEQPPSASEMDPG